jgi:hypothetical protein
MTPDVLRWLGRMLIPSFGCARNLLTTGRRAQRVSGFPTTSVSTLSSCSTYAAVNSCRSSTTARMRQLSTGTSSMRRMSTSLHIILHHLGLHPPTPRSGPTPRVTLLRCVSLCSHRIHVMNQFRSMSP